jgi:hypothetical protein
MSPEPPAIAPEAHPGLPSAIGAHRASRTVSRVIYGAIVGLALVVSLQDHPPTPGVMVGTILATAIAVGLAELYSEVMGARTRSRRWREGQRLRRIADDVGAVVFGVGFPAAFFVLAAAGVIGVGTAFAAAKWSGLGLISFYGFCAARLAGAKLAESLLQGLAVGIVGGLLIAFKALVH